MPARPIAVTLLVLMSVPVHAVDVNFNRDVRPILAKHCFTCHGPDEAAREADLRLDQPDRDFELADIVDRITNEDEDLRMPPAENHPPLSQRDVELVSAWVDGGGQYETHWSFVAPLPCPAPQLDPESRSQAKNFVDAFLLDRMDQAGLTFAKPASDEAWLRRVHLDLVGIGPTVAEQQRFADDRSFDRDQTVIDRLLADPRYAERFARVWLDLARYADSNGYEKDRPRTIWPYRDWVIDAMANDMPFDQFTIEQLAGDMLDDPSDAQRIATGFHRNTMLNEEGGIDPLEFRWLAVIDRVATTGTVWMGLTTGCAQCHTHKYDPITHTDYFSLFALLNQSDEPSMRVASEDYQARLTTHQNRIDTVRKRLIDEHLPTLQQFKKRSFDGPLAEPFNTFVSESIANARDWTTLRPSGIESSSPTLSVQADGSILASGDATKRDTYRIEFDLEQFSNPIQAIRLDTMQHESLPGGGPGLTFYEGRSGQYFVSEMRATLDGNDIGLVDITQSGRPATAKSDASKITDGDVSSGWSGDDFPATDDWLVANLESPLPTNGTLVIEMTFARHYVVGLGHFRFSVSDHPDAVATSLPRGIDQSLVDNNDIENDSKLFADMQTAFLNTDPSMAEHRKRYDGLYRQTPSPVRTLVMSPRQDDHQRATHRHHRGEYLQPSEAVAPSIPTVLGSLPSDQPADRLTLARWLVSQDNPLVARVVVNRAWRAFFGHGIVRTTGDYGTQSDPPSHPELLDDLAVRFRQNGWSMKWLHRQLVSTAAYRQRVDVPPGSDPLNQLLSVFPHRRLDGELIRDNVLAASGKLDNTSGGPSVYPPQVVGVLELSYGKPKWINSVGGDRYRRSLYTFSKRTAPFAALQTFDAPSGEQCIARRDQSTTPLQALTLLNDEMYYELAASIAEHLPDETGTPSKVTAIYRRLLSRSPTSDELKRITSFIESNNSDSAATWTLVVRAVMNTDEAITIP